MNFNSVSGKNWVFKTFNPNDIKYLSESYNLNETTAKLLSIRKKNIDDIDFYLNPTIKNSLPNPLQLKDMDKAVDRVLSCIKKKELIGIFGDYDVDGAASTALLSRYFFSINDKKMEHTPEKVEYKKFSEKRRVVSA